MTEASNKEVKKSVLIQKGSALGRAVFAALLFNAFQLLFQYNLLLWKLDNKFNDGLYQFLGGIFLFCILCAYIAIIKKPKEESLIRREHMNTVQWTFVVIIGIGLIAYVGFYFSFANYLSEIFSEVKESMAEYTEHVSRDVSTPDNIIPAWDHVLYLLAVSVIVPIYEEIAFRGIVLGELKRKFSPATAIVLSGLIFGALHNQPIQVGYAALCGIALGAIYYFCDSIWASITVHAIFNFLGTGMKEFLDSGVIPGISSGVKESIIGMAINIEFLMLFPTIFAFVFLGLIHKQEKEKKRVVMEVVHE